VFQEAVSFLAFAEGVSQTILPIHVVWVNFQFNGFPDESIHIFGFLQKDVLYPVLQHYGPG